MDTKENHSVKKRSFLSVLSSENDNNIFDIIARTIFFTAIFLLPLFILPSLNILPDAGKSIFAAGAVVLVLLFWLFARLKGGVLVLPRSILLLFLGIVALLFLIAAVFSPAFVISFEGLTYESGTAVAFLVLFLVTALAAFLFQSPKNILGLYTVLFTSYGIVFLFQASRLLFGNEFLSLGIFVNKTAGLIGKWNDLGIFAGLFILLTLITLETLPLKKKWYRGILFGILATGLLLLAIVNFYPAWVLIGFLALGMFVYSFSFARIQTQKTRTVPLNKKFPVTSFVVLLISLVFLVGGNVVSGFMNDRLNIVQLEVRPSWESTRSVLSETIKESPLLGSGPNRFSNQWLRFKPEGINASPFWNIDFNSGVGIMPTFAVTTGVLGSVALLLFFAAFLYKGFRFLFSVKDERVNYILFSSFTAALYIWVISLLYVPGTVLMFLAALFSGVFVGALVHAGKVKNYTLSYFKDPRLGFVIVLVLIVLIIATAGGGFLVSKKVLSINAFQQGRNILNVGGDLGEAERNIQKALTYSESDAYYRALSEIKTRQLAALLSRQDPTPDTARVEFRAILGDSILAGQQAIAVDETNYQNWTALFRVYRSVVPVVEGAYENATIAINKARELNPKNPALLLEQSRLEVANNNNEQARTLLGEALFIKQDYVDAIFMVAQLDSAEGNIEGAIAAVEEATFLAPNNAGLFFQLGLLRYNNEEYTSAVLAFERALAINSEFANARYFLGLSSYNLGRTADAILHFEQLQQTNAENKEVESILRNLRDGKNPFANSSQQAIEERTEPPLEE
ncbi:hypothetical protein CL630_02105 [bacterium]|nr:hypothetical protein [bacterium]|tara:strand:- start:5497 stop:7887 length:2391 start_codon:yes stop_codon:yes gene_type:complete